MLMLKLCAGMLMARGALATEELHCPSPDCPDIESFPGRTTEGVFAFAGMHGDHTGLLGAGDKVYSLQCVGGTTYTVEVQVITLADSQIEVLSLDQQQVYASDSYNGGSSSVTFTAPDSFTVLLVVGGNGGEGSFTLSVQANGNPCDEVNGGWRTDSDLEGDIFFSSAYENSVQCEWTIDCGTHSGLHPCLNFNNFDTESGYDFVDVYGDDINADDYAPNPFDADGVYHEDGTGDRLAHLSGAWGQDFDVSARTLRSPTSAMVLQFNADYSVTRGGWSASYTCKGHAEKCPIQAMTQGVEQTITLEADERLCINAWTGALEAGTELKLYTCSGAANEVFVYGQDGTIRVAADPTLCLNVCGGINVGDNGAGSSIEGFGCASSNGNWETVILYTCSAALNEQWSMENDGTIRSRASPDLCLNADTGAMAVGDAIIVYPCSADVNEVWIPKTYESGHRRAQLLAPTPAVNDPKDPQERF